MIKRVLDGFTQQAFRQHRGVGFVQPVFELRKQRYTFFLPYLVSLNKGFVLDMRLNAIQFLNVIDNRLSPFSLVCLALVWPPRICGEYGQGKRPRSLGCVGTLGNHPH